MRVITSVIAYHEVVYADLPSQFIAAKFSSRLTIPVIYSEFIALFPTWRLYR